ncbi:TetR family transcriptional regulator [Arthrobacter sp. SLBN-53]|nr:TetR family transcriptional regulator [Arthrobacter sp. SLBN-53]
MQIEKNSVEPLCQDGPMAVSRRYGGQTAVDRVAERRAKLLAAGLELMGTRGIAGTTVRGVTEASGVAARYFYESFADIEALHLAVYTEVIEEAACRSVAALEQAPDDALARTRAVLGELVDLILGDRRKGRILVLEATATPALGRRSLAESSRFAGMLAATAAGGDPAAAADGLPTDLRLVSQFLVGGVTASIGAVLLGDIDLDREHLVDVLVSLFEAIRAAAPG